MQAAVGSPSRHEAIGRARAFGLRSVLALQQFWEFPIQKRITSPQNYCEVFLLVHFRDSLLLHLVFAALYSQRPCLCGRVIAMGGGASLPAETYAVSLGGISSRPYLSGESQDHGRAARVEMVDSAGPVVTLEPVTLEPVVVTRAPVTEKEVDAVAALRVVDNGRQYLHAHENQQEAPAESSGLSYELSKPEELVRFLREAKVSGGAQTESR